MYAPSYTDALVFVVSFLKELLIAAQQCRVSPVSLDSILLKRSAQNSMAYRRKTLSKSSSAGKRVGVKGPKGSKKRSRKAAKYSPNRRYNKTAKLNTVKRKGFNTKKRRKQNFRRNKKKYKSKSKGRRYR